MCNAFEMSTCPELSVCQDAWECDDTFSAAMCVELFTAEGGTCDDGNASTFDMCDGAGTCVGKSK